MDKKCIRRIMRLDWTGLHKDYRYPGKEDPVVHLVHIFEAICTGTRKPRNLFKCKQWTQTETMSNPSIAVQYTIYIGSIQLLLSIYQFSWCTFKINKDIPPQSHFLSNVNSAVGQKIQIQMKYRLVNNKKWPE